MRDHPGHYLVRLLQNTYPTVKYGKTCPYCGSGETWLQQGREMNIKQIEGC